MHGGHNRKIIVGGTRFNRLTVIEESGIEIYKYGTAIKYLCRCDCGKLITTTGIKLRAERVKSCGCLNRDNVKKAVITHGLSRTRLHRIWGSMKQRCLNPKNTNYKFYRNMKIFDLWVNDFYCFYKWAISNGYSENLTLDRINNDRGYYPSNCRWTTMQEQNTNRRDNIRVTIFGENKCLSEWIRDERCIVSESVFRERINKNIDPYTALTQPMNRRFINE